MKVGILTGGGDCPGLNGAIRAIVMHGLDYGFSLTGIRDGWKGLIEKKIFPLNLEVVEELSNKGGTILGSSRTNPYKVEKGVEKIKENIKSLGLNAIIAIGGEDTLGAANKLNEEGIPVVGVPKTMDNDLSATDYTFGFDSASSIALDALDRLRDTGKSHHRIMVLEVMGRHTGWVALYTGLAGGADWILIPEIKVHLEEMCSHLKKVHQRKGYGLVVASEGIEIPGSYEEKASLDQFGHMLLKERGVGETLAREIEKSTGASTRSAVIGHVQRGGSPTLFDRLLSLRAGVKAVDLVKEGKFGTMACLKGNRMEAVPLKEAVAKLKTVDEEWWNLARVFFK